MMKVGLPHSSPTPCTQSAIIQQQLLYPKVHSGSHQVFFVVEITILLQSVKSRLITTHKFYTPCSAADFNTLLK
jgi:hypothetical protein